jgi:hypothetical protein
MIEISFCYSGNAADFAEIPHHGCMKVRICFLVMALAPILYYGFAQMAPAGRAATVSTGFRTLGKAALQKIESAQEAVNEPEDVFAPRLAEAENALNLANGAAVSAADRRDYTRLVSYLHDVKEDRTYSQLSNDGSSNQQQGQEQTNAARESAERAFN